MRTTRSARTRKPRKRRDTYLDLVRAFPLRAIRTEDEALAAGEALNRVLLSKPDGGRDPGERAYIDALQELILAYQARHPLPKVPPLELLKFLMQESGMTVSDLGRVIGNQPSASLLLSGKRPMSKSQILKLARHFKVSPALFLEADDK
jgi:antitoxin component HigA of HigAB toxin-antitoxin module